MSAGRVSVGHPVDVGSGSVYTISHDFRLPGGLPILWRRYYSTTSPSDSWLGPKWSVPYFMTLERRESKYILFGAHGEEVAFPSPTGQLKVGAKLTNLSAKMELVRERDQYRIAHWHTGGNTSRFCFKPKSEGRVPLAAIENISGHRVRVDVDANSRPIRLTQELEQRTIEITYDRRNLIESIHFQGSAGPKLLVRYEYDAKRRLTNAFDIMGNRQGYEYDHDNRMVAESNPLGSKFLFTYDYKGRCTRTAGSDGFLERKLQYSTTPPSTRVTDSRGGVTVYLLNPAGQVIQLIDPLGAVTTNTFDEQGRVVGVIQPDGATESFAFDEQGNQTVAVDPMGAAAKTEYDDNHLPTRTTDRNGNGWSVANKNAGSLLGVENLPPLAWTYTRDSRGLVTLAESPGGRRIEVRRDPKFRWIELHDQISLISRTEYDEMGNAIAEYDAEGVISRTRYDDLNRAIEVTRGPNNVTRYRWNGIGNMTEQTGPGEQHDTKVYDKYGHLLIAMNISGDSATYEYDTEGHWTSITNRVGERLEYRRDLAGRIVESKHFDGRIQRFEHDMSGRVVTISLSDGRTVRQKYDPAGRLLRRAASDGLVDEFEYDKDGREIKATNRFATVELKRDRYGNILGEVQSGNSIDYWYDVDNNRTRRLLPFDLPAAKTRFGFDMRSRLISVSDELECHQQFFWDRIDRLVERSSPGGLFDRYIYDAQRHLHQHQVLSRASSFAQTYLYDVNGSIISQSDSEHEGYQYSYDRLQRLNEVRLNDKPIELYRYDANNACIETHRGPRRLSTGGKTIQAGSEERTYAADGSVEQLRVDNSVRTFKHDVNGHLTEVIFADGAIVRYEYDPFGRRTAKIANGVRTEFLWEVWQLAAEIQDGKLQRVYIASDVRPLAQWQMGSLYTPVLDQRGAVVKMFDERSQLRWAGTLDAYGNLTSQRGDVPSPFRLRGQYADDESGLYYNYSRHYDPVLGDYTSPDPIDIAGGYNLYAYPRNPLQWDDPYGLKCDIPANHPPEDDPKTSTNKPPKPLGPITGGPHPERDDLTGGKHSPDTPTSDVAANALRPGTVKDPATGKYVPATVGPNGQWVPAKPGDPPVYTPQGQWNSADAARNAAAKYDNSPGAPRVQTVEIDKGKQDGTVTRAVDPPPPPPRETTYPPPPGVPTVAVPSNQGPPVRVEAPPPPPPPGPVPERTPTDRAIAIKNPDGTIHTYPIPPDHPNYNNPVSDGTPTPDGA